MVGEASIKCLPPQYGAFPLSWWPGVTVLFGKSHFSQLCLGRNDYATCRWTYCWLHLKTFLECRGGRLNPGPDISSWSERDTVLRGKG